MDVGFLPQRDLLLFSMFVELALQTRVVAEISGAIAAASYASAHLGGDSRTLCRAINQFALCEADLTYAAESGLWRPVCKERLLRTEPHAAMYLGAVSCWGAHLLQSQILASCAHLRRPIGLMVAPGLLEAVEGHLASLSIPSFRIGDVSGSIADACKSLTVHESAGFSGIYLASAEEGRSARLMRAHLAARCTFVGALSPELPDALWSFHDQCLVGGVSACIAGDDTVLFNVLGDITRHYVRLTDFEAEVELYGIFHLQS